MARPSSRPNVNILDTDKVGSLLVKLAAPAFMGMFVQTLYNVVNTIFIGRYVGPLGIAGLSIVFPLQMLSWGFSQMVGMGGASVISRFLGSRDTTGAEKTVGNGVTLSIIIGVVVTLILLPFMEFWLRLIGASDEVMVYAKPYMMIVMSATVFNVFAMALLSFVRAEGNARVGMTAMLIGAGLSIILDWIFIVPMHMGVVGAALATIISQTLSMIYLLIYYLTGNSYLKIRLQYLRPDIKILKQIFAIGIAAFVQTVAGSLSAMMMIKMVISYGGDAALGAFGIIQRVLMFATMPAMVFGQSLQPVLGFNFGARRFQLALKAVYIAVAVSTSLSLVAFTLLYIFPDPIIRIFTDDAQLLAVGRQASRLVFLSLPLMGTMMIGQLIFQAIGKAMQSFITAIVRPVVFLIPLVLILSRLWGLDGVFLAFPTSDALTLVLAVVLVFPILREFRQAAAAEKQKSELVPVPAMADNRTIDGRQA